MYVSVRIHMKTLALAKRFMIFVLFVYLFKFCFACDLGSDLECVFCDVRMIKILLENALTRACSLTENENLSI